jgi:hypothetical protein
MATRHLPLEPIEPDEFEIEPPPPPPDILRELPQLSEVAPEPQDGDEP